MQQIIRHTIKVLEENPHFRGTSLEEFGITIEQEKEWIRAHNERGFLLIVEADDIIIGMINFQLSTKKKFKHEGLLGMSIQEAFTNQGLGRALIEKLLEWAKDDNRVEKVSLEVFSNNARVIYLYKKLGFVEEGRRKKQAKLGPDGVRR